MSAAALLLVLAAPPPSVQVCLRGLWEPPCGVSPLPVEATVSPTGVDGPASLRWLIDAVPDREQSVTLSDGVTTRHLLLLEPRRTVHRVRLEVRQGSAVASAELVVEDACCPFDLAARPLDVEPGRRVVLTLENRGPSASGPGRIRWLLNGVRMVSSVVPSLEPAASYEESVPWSALPKGRRQRITVLLELSSGDLDAVDNLTEAVVAVP